MVAIIAFRKKVWLEFTSAAEGTCKDFLYTRHNYTFKCIPNFFVGQVGGPQATLQNGGRDSREKLSLQVRALKCSTGRPRGAKDGARFFTKVGMCAKLKRRCERRD